MNDQKRPGDSGRSGTLNRRDIPKDSPVFELLGALEECAAQIAAARLKAPGAVAPILEALCADLQALSAEIAGGPRFATGERIRQLEKALEPLAEAGGQAPNRPLVSEGGASLYLARAVARRAERKAVAMTAVGGAGREVIAYLNRLSGLLGALAALCDRGESQTAAPGETGLPSALDGQGLCAAATALCSKVIAHARSEDLAVVAAVCDTGGNLVCLMRDDGALLASIDVAMGKAYTSASLKMDTETLGQLAQPGGALYGVQHTNQGKIVVFGGGVPLYAQGRLWGALGVSGGTPQQDSAIARWGAQNF